MNSVPSSGFRRLFRGDDSDPMREHVDFTRPHSQYATGITPTIYAMSQAGGSDPTAASSSVNTTGTTITVQKITSRAETASTGLSNPTPI